MEAKICQSCGMPMMKDEDFGINADRSRNSDYCKHCYQNGEFTDPEITKEQMIEKIVNIMAQMKGISKEQAGEEAKPFIPKLIELKRWRR